MLTGSASATSPPICIGDGRATGVAIPKIIKTHPNCITGGRDVKGRF